MTGRWTYRISAAGVLVLAAAAFSLSYDALHQLALDSRVRPGLAWMWPVVIDGTIVVALLTVLAAELAALGRATPGQRNHTLNRSVFKVYRYVAGGVLDDQAVTAAFTTAALAIGLDPAEVRRTLASARTAGLATPRSVPGGATRDGSG